MTLRVFALLVFLAAGRASATALEPLPPADFSPLVPIMTWLPQSFFAGGYNVKLTVTEMRIDHVAERSRATLARRGCTVSFSYAQPMGGDLFSTRVDMPLLAAEGLGSDWRRGSIGDYVLFFSNTPQTSKTFRLLASAKF